MIEFVTNLLISSYTISKLVRFFETQCRC